MSGMEHSEAVDSFVAEYGALDDLICSLDDDQLVAPSGCRGWNNADLIFHLLLDAQRALVTFNSPAQGPSDKDFVTYWEGFQASSPSSRAHARFVRISASAHSDPKMLSERWHETAQAAMRCATSTDEIEYVGTQGHVLRTADFIATLVVEACVHHFDLLANIGDKQSPAAPALSITTRTLHGMLRHEIPTDWDDATFVLKATGRRSLTQDDLQVLGETAQRFPLFS